MASTLNSPRNNSLSNDEKSERQDDLEKVIRLLKSITKRLDEASSMTNSALSDADKLFDMCNRNQVLRAAMISRRLSLQKIMKDIKGTSSIISLTVKFIWKNIDRRDDLEKIIQDPDLLR